MHPQIQQEKPGTCPLCGMKLVEKSSLQTTTVPSSVTYTPLFVIIGLILLSSLTIVLSMGFSFKNLLYSFMIGFFLVFSGFKLLDLHGFAQGYAIYDLLAQRVFGYGYIYPFVELFFGLAMILHFQITILLVVEIVVMGFSGIGVALKLAKHEKFQCACLGTFLKIPLTKVTLIEDFGMAALAVMMLFIR